MSCEGPLQIIDHVLNWNHSYTFRWREILMKLNKRHSSSVAILVWRNSFAVLMVMISHWTLSTYPLYICINSLSAFSSAKRSTAVQQGIKNPNQIDYYIHKYSHITLCLYLFVWVDLVNGTQIRSNNLQLCFNISNEFSKTYEYMKIFIKWDYKSGISKLFA